MPQWGLLGVASGQLFGYCGWCACSHLLGLTIRQLREAVNTAYNNRNVVATLWTKLGRYVHMSPFPHPSLSFLTPVASLPFNPPVHTHSKLNANSVLAAAENLTNLPLNERRWAAAMKARGGRLLTNATKTDFSRPPSCNTKDWVGESEFMAMVLIYKCRIIILHPIDSFRSVMYSYAVDDATGKVTVNTRDFFVWATDALKAGDVCLTWSGAHYNAVVVGSS